MKSNADKNLVLENIEQRFAAIKESLTNFKILYNQEKNNLRPSLIKPYKVFTSYGPIVDQNVFETYSSAEESDMEEERQNEASIRDVYNAVWDYYTIMILVNIYLTRTNLSFLLKPDMAYYLLI
jgi:hypothetical protein